MENITILLNMYYSMVLDLAENPQDYSETNTAVVLAGAARAKELIIAKMNDNNASKLEKMSILDKMDKAYEPLVDTNTLQ